MTGFLDLVHRPVFQKTKTFRELDLFPSSGEVWETPTLLGPLNDVKPFEVTQQSRWTMDKVKRNSNSECSAAFSEPFRIHCIRGGPKSGPCTATFNDLLCFLDSTTEYVSLSNHTSSCPLLSSSICVHLFDFVFSAFLVLLYLNSQCDPV
jgi:hypothetical protein